MKPRPRCDRGHFLPAGAWPGIPCEHERQEAYHGSYMGNFWGQRITGYQVRTMTTVPLAGAWL
jgi:hypothetical protein